MRVLIVDDERNIRESLQRLLTLEGMEAVCADGGLSAMDLLATGSFDVVVTDLKMPGMGGQLLLEHIRELGLRCPVILISALGETGDTALAFRAGASDYLVKPFDPGELILKLKAAISSMRMGHHPETGSRTAGP